jgi:hypothetical protein
MHENIGRSLGTDYFLIADQLNPRGAQVPAAHPRLRRQWRTSPFRASGAPVNGSLA